jgi:selenide,water dikinase
MKNMEKRQRVMRRSMQLGHCICHPNKDCPCDVFLEKDVCPCAGERLEAPSGPTRLTELVDRPGCASKIDAAALKRVLKGLPFADDPRVLVGVPAGDDAGVFKLDDDLALVQTVDVFTPSVDDPYTFGQIAAANSVSDVYAMGGTPLTALSIVGFPIRTLPDDVMREILRGGIDKMAEAGVAVVGGHSINDAQIKAGFAVTGVVNPNKIVANDGLQPGDRLILTKPIGLGIMAFAAQIDRAPEGGPQAAARTMAALNKRACELMIEFDAHACTDVTGFGLMGHLGGMASSSKVDVEIVWDDIPLLEGILQCAADGIIPGAVERNREASADCMVADDNLQPAMLDICFDAQTSGGLLIAVGESVADELLTRLREGGCPEAAVIGRVLETASGRIFVRHEGRREMPPRRQADRSTAKDRAKTEPATSCCAEQGTAETQCSADKQPSGDCGSGEAGGAGNTQENFMEFMKCANAPGAFDARTKQAMAIALSVVTKCEPCLKIHIGKAREMGFSQEEIDEAAWMAIAFGGSPTMMFYNRLRRS